MLLILNLIENIIKILNRTVDELKATVVVVLQRTKKNEGERNSEIEMAIFARPVGTRPGPTLMDRVLPSPIRNRVGYGFKKKNPKWVRVLSKKPETRPETQPV